MGKEPILGAMALSIRVSFRIIMSLGKADSLGVMEVIMLERSSKERGMGRESITVQLISPVTKGLG